MSNIVFGAQVEQLQAMGIELAKAATPDFALARHTLREADDIVSSGNDSVKAAIFSGRTLNDLGVVDVREGLYLRAHAGATDREALGRAASGVGAIEFSYRSLVDLLSAEQLTLGQRGWLPDVHAHIAGTMNTWFRATQTGQLLKGDIGPDTKADQATTEAQWMLGRGRPDEPGAWKHGRQGNNGYWAAQTCFLGVRGERINGGAVHLVGALKWGLVRGVPELGRQVVADPAHRKQAVLTAGRLSLESTTRRGAIAAALDYQRF